MQQNEKELLLQKLAEASQKLQAANKQLDEARAKLMLRWEELERHGVFSSMKWGKITEIHKN